MPLFLAGNATPTIPHLNSKRKDFCFPTGCNDAASVDGRRDSNVYEVNLWLLQFGRGKPHLGGLSVEETEERKQADRHERDEIHVSLDSSAAEGGSNLNLIRNELEVWW